MKMYARKAGEDIEEKTSAKKKSAARKHEQHITGKRTQSRCTVQIYD
jgi:hypothetical protein